MNKPYRRLFDLPDIEVPVPTKESVIGFLLVWLAALAMIGGLLLLVEWIKA